MTTDSTWDRTRWGDRGPHQGGRDGRDGHDGHLDAMQAPPLPAPSAIRNSPPSGILGAWPRDLNLSPPSDGDSNNQSQRLPSLMDSYATVAPHPSRLHDRHSPSARAKYDPQPLAESSEKATSWQSLRYHRDDRGHERQNTDVPLTLHIPKTQDLLRTAPGYTVIPHERHSTNMRDSRSNQTTSLPSFASLQEQAGRINDSDDLESASSASARLSCYLCNKLQPMVKDVATAVVELDESIQTSCNKSIIRVADCPQDNPIRAVQWILERLRCAKTDLQAAARGAQLNYGYQPTPSTSGVSGLSSSTNISPSTTFKRPADRWDFDEGPLPKRPRSGPSPTEIQAPLPAYPLDHRRASIDVVARDQSSSRTFSPPTTDSVPNSAWPKTGSPPPSGRAMITLPSPSSIAYPPSAAPSLLTQTAQSVGSPGTSYQPAPSLHSVSTNSATSAHIADLQHQVTLKSLSLQTLQSEYASLLSKLQRLNVKTQAMERKSNVADEEVNHLTNKNEDLTQQLQSLQEQLDDSERRKEKLREEATREKDQWLQMLEQGRQIQAKYEDDKRVLIQQITALQRGKEGGSGSAGNQDAILHGVVAASQASASTVGSSRETPTDVPALKAKIEILRLALEEARQNSRALQDTAYEFGERSGRLGASIDRALDDPATAAKGQTSEKDHEHEELGTISKFIDPHEKSATSPSLPDDVKARAGAAVPQPSSSSSPSFVAEKFSSFASGASSGSENVAIDIAASNCTPEDVIKALGPVPSPPSPIQFRVTGAKLETGSGDRKRGDSITKRNRLSESWDQSITPTPGLRLPHEAKNVGSFRPLLHHEAEHCSNPVWSAVQGERVSQSHDSPPALSQDDRSSASSRLTSSQSPEHRPEINTQIEWDWVAAPSGPISNSKCGIAQHGFYELGRDLGRASYHRHKVSSRDAGLSSYAMPPPPPPPRPTT